MRPSDIKTSRQFNITKNTRYGIQNYDVCNDFPQRVDEIVSASGAGSACISTRARFIFGLGLPPEVGGIVVNDNNETLNDVVKKLVEDYAKFESFGIHANVNGNARVTAIYSTPVEHIRLGLKDSTSTIRYVAVHPDWGRRYQELIKFSQKDIQYIDLFNPTSEAVLAQAAKVGWAHYKGQLLYYSSAGALTYPCPSYVSQLKNMRTEEAIDTIACRNAASNFLPSRVIVDYNNTPESEEQREELENQIADFIGDDEACSVMVVSAKSKEEKFDSVDLSGENYDKAFEVTQSYVPDRIGRAFMQPPILRAVDVGSNFGADALTNAYNFYNAITESDRNIIEREVKRVLAVFKTPFNLDKIQLIPLSYRVGQTIAERVGEKASEKIIELATSAVIPLNQKRGLLGSVYGLNELEINNILAE